VYTYLRNWEEKYERLGHVDVDIARHVDVDSARHVDVDSARHVDVDSARRVPCPREFLISHGAESGAMVRPHLQISLRKITGSATGVFLLRPHSREQEHLIAAEKSLVYRTMKGRLTL
jgi:hypothetical protein